MRHPLVFLFFLLLFGILSSPEASSQPLSADTADIHSVSSFRHWGYEADLQVGQVLVLDKYQKSYMRKKSSYSSTLKFNHVSLPSDSDSYAHDYHYPTFSIVARFSKNDGATMHRDADYPHWVNKSEDYYELVPYNTHLGNSFGQ